MRLLLIIALSVSAALCVCAFDHPFDEAASKLKQAQKKYDLAETELKKAIQLIDDKEKRDAALEALKRGAEAWEKVSKFESEFKIAAAAAPNTATSVGLIPYWTEAQFLNYRAEQLNAHAKWIRENWQK